MEFSYNPNLEYDFTPNREQDHAAPRSLPFRIDRVLCYANANLTRAEQPGEVCCGKLLWIETTGRSPGWATAPSNSATLGVDFL